MALGLPIITTNDAIFGMNLKDSKGIYIADNLIDYSEICLTLLQEKNKNISEGKTNSQYSKVPGFLFELINNRQRT